MNWANYENIKPKFKVRPPLEVGNISIIQDPSHSYQGTYLLTFSDDLITFGSATSAPLQIYPKKLSLNGNVKAIFVDYEEVVRFGARYVTPELYFCSPASLQKFVDQTKKYIRESQEISFENRLLRQ